MNKTLLMGIFILILLFSFISASDVLVWQGQYHTGKTFNTGAYEFNLSVYDSLTGGEICYSNTTTLTTGDFGEWKFEAENVCCVCNNASKDYFLEIKIDGEIQGERRRVTMFKFLRKNVDEITSGTLQTDSQVVAPIIQANSQVVAPIIQANSQVVAPKVNATEIITDNINITASMNLFGVLKGHSPLKLQDEINFIKTDGTITSSLYNAPRLLNSSLPSAFDDSLIHDIIEETNDYGMQECFWDENTETMQMCISGAYLGGRATTISRSLQVVGNTTDKPINENFTLCEGNKYIDCETDLTGADLLVEDDIETIGSIYSQENVTAEYFIGNKSYLTGLQLGTQDAFGRNQIWNFLASSILRLGSLASDGDATTVSSEGIVVYGEDLNGDNMTSANFSYARIKPNRIGLYTSLNAIAGYYFRVNPLSLYLADDSFVKTFEVMRETGNVTSGGNITANYFVGNGSLLTNVCLSDGANCQSFNDTQKNSDGIYLYNDSTTIYFNETKLNQTIDDRSNSLWNASGSYLYPNDLSKSLGVGKNDPHYKLDINGEIGLDGYEILDINKDYITFGDLDGGGSNGIKFLTDYGNEVVITNNADIVADGNVTADKIQGEYYSSDSSQGMTDISHYNICMGVTGTKCDAWCNLQIKNGIITGCV